MSNSPFRAVPRPWIAPLIGVALAACEPGPTPPADIVQPEASELRLGRDALVADGAFFVGDFQAPIGRPTNSILRYDAHGDFVDVFVASDMERFMIPCCMTFGPDDNIYAASPLFRTILRFNGATGEFIDEFVTADEGGLTGVLIPRFGPDGNLYVGDFGTHSIRRYNGRTGDFIDVFVEAGAGGMTASDPQFFVWGPDSHLYVAAPSVGKVLRFDGESGELLGTVVLNQEGRPRVGPGLAFGDDGLLYVNGGDVVARYDAGTGEFVDVFVQPGSGLSTPVEMIFGPDGHLYIASAGTGSVMRFDGNTGAFIDHFVPAGRGGIAGPRTISFKMKMNVCHRPPGSPAAPRTLSVGQLDAADHVAHGDDVGAC